MEFEYVLSVYGVGSTQWLENHPKIHLSLYINSIIWFTFTILQPLLLLITDDWNFNQIFSTESYQLLHLITFTIILMSLISFIYATKKINDLRKMLEKMRKMSQTSTRPSKIYLTLAVLFFSAQIAMICMAISAFESGPTIQQIFEFNPSYNGIYINYLKKLLCLTSKFSAIILTSYPICWKIISMLIYTLFNHEYTNKINCLFLKLTLPKSSLVPQPHDIVKVDKSLFDLITIKSNINAYFRFNFYCVLFDTFVFMIVNLILFRQMVLKENNLLGFSSWCVIFIVWLSFVLIFIIKRPKRRLKNMDMIIWIRKMERLISIQKDRKLHDRFIYMEYQELEKRFNDFLK
jgi:hypothetical protein